MCRRLLARRAGTSKGLFFHEGDLPASRAGRDALFLDALGSADPYGRQLDGMGGGISSLSKVVSVRAIDDQDADLAFTFGQVAVDRALVDYVANCGNLTAAVGPFAVDEGLCVRGDGDALVRLRNTNTGKLIHARFPVREGRAESAGSLAIPGVAGTGAPIELAFLDPGGARTGALLPTGRARDVLDSGQASVVVTLVDAVSPLVVVRASDLSLHGGEGPDVLEAIPRLMVAIDSLRRAAGVAIGLADAPGTCPLATPKVAVVAAPQDYSALDGTLVAATECDLVVRAVSMERLHRAIPVTAALALAVALQIPGTLPPRACRGDARHADDPARHAVGHRHRRCRAGLDRWGPLRTQRIASPHGAPSHARPRRTPLTRAAWSAFAAIRDTWRVSREARRSAARGRCALDATRGRLPRPTAQADCPGRAPTRPWRAHPLLVGTSRNSRELCLALSEGVSVR